MFVIIVVITVLIITVVIGNITFMILFSCFSPKLWSQLSALHLFVRFQCKSKQNDEIILRFITQEENINSRLDMNFISLDKLEDCEHQNL